MIGWHIEEKTFTLSNLHYLTGKLNNNYYLNKQQAEQRLKELQGEKL